MSLISTFIPINPYTTLFLIFWQQSHPSEICNRTCDSRSRHNAQAEAKVVSILLSNPAHSRVFPPLFCFVLDKQIDLNSIRLQYTYLILVTNILPLIYGNPILKAMLVVLTLFITISHVLSLLIIFLEVFVNIII